MRVLIVGCGYVGVALGAELQRQGHEVFGLSRTAANREDLEAAAITPLIGDITQPHTLLPLHRTWDWVVNCVSASGGAAEQYRQVYLEGTRNLIEWLGESPLQKFVYTSSTGVYGQTDGSIVTETSPTEPDSETAKILVETEKELNNAAFQRQFPAVVLRVSGIYGPGRGYWLRQFITEQARIEGRGERIVNMVHRDDVAGAIIAALQKGGPGEIYNVTDDEPVTQQAMFEWLSEKLRKPMPPSAAQDDAPSRKRGVTNKRVSNLRLRTKLGYVLKYPTFREGYSAELLSHPK